MVGPHYPQNGRVDFFGYRYNRIGAENSCTLQEIENLA